jgi:hypothetical protein
MFKHLNFVLKLSLKFFLLSLFIILKLISQDVLLLESDSV